ncbi:MAG: nucleotide pyrophosphohydrolase [Deltaproteobacteria bacterium]|nr:MAG: nucleotide pyrophosphohydrolase [Deltaproteobacteria bacterium]
MTDSGKQFDQFVDIVRKLRSDNGCPWDRDQSPLSLKRYLKEETRELLEAIESGDNQHIKEELGDLLYLIVLLAQIFNEEDLFAIGDVVETISKKMVRRHPHVFKDESIGSTAELRQRWLEIKDNEKAERSKNKKN